MVAFSLQHLFVAKPGLSGRPISKTQQTEDATNSRHTYLCRAYTSVADPAVCVLVPALGLTVAARLSKAQQAQANPWCRGAEQLAVAVRNPPMPELEAPWLSLVPWTGGNKRCFRNL
jgi:hypothetical protein